MGIGYNYAMITITTASILALIYVFLAIFVIKMRYKYRVSINSNHEPELDYAIRAHANFNEYVPLSLILLYFAEENFGDNIFLMIISVALICGRVCHAHAFLTMQNQKNKFKTRQIGMVLTFSTLIILAISLLSFVIS